MLHAFHESYFEHPCTVATELDVLATDIQGDGWREKLKRWYFSWILLSYDDDRCRVYFLSSHALRLERARHYRRYRGRIHPLSKFNNMWTILYFIIIILKRLLFHVNTAMFYGSQPIFTITMGMICEFMALVDLAISFKTGYTDEVTRNVVLDATMGITQFASTKLFLYVAAAIPLQGILMLRYGFSKCTLCRANLFISTLKFISFVTLPRLYIASSFLGQQRSSFKKMHICKCLRIIVLALFTMLQLTDFIDTINVLLMLKVKMVYRDSFLNMILQAKSQMHTINDIFFMAVEFSNLCKSVMLFGYGLYRHDYYVDKIFSLVCHTIGCIFVTWGGLECYSIVQRQKYVNDEATVRRERTKIWMQSCQLSDKIYHKVDEYGGSNLSHSRFVERHNDLYRFLPTILIREIKLTSYFSYVRRVPCFTEWPVDVVEELVMMLKDKIYLERDVISHPFNQGEGLVIVFAGVLAVYNVSHKEIGHLIDGDYFGELSLITDNEVRTSTVSAVTICQVLTLHKRDFRKMMRKYTKLFFEMRGILLQKYDMNQSISEDINR